MGGDGQRKRNGIYGCDSGFGEGRMTFGKGE